MKVKIMSDELPVQINWNTIREQWLPSIRRTLVPLITVFIINLVGQEFVQEGMITEIVALLLGAVEYGAIRFFEIKAGGPVLTSALIGGKSAPIYSGSEFQLSSTTAPGYSQAGPGSEQPLESRDIRSEIDSLNYEILKLQDQVRIGAFSSQIAEEVI